MPLSLLDALSELLVVGDDSDVLQGLSTPFFSGVEGAGQVPEGNLMNTGLTVGIGAWLLMGDRCCSSCSTPRGEVLAKGFEDLGRHMGLGM